MKARKFDYDVVYARTTVRTHTSCKPMPDVKLILAVKRTGETEKEKVGRQASEAQLEKELEQERKKTKETYFVGGTT